MKFSKITTHVHPHLDEVAAIRLLIKHGEAKFPGISTAHIEYCGTGISPYGKTWQEHYAEGTLLIGLGGGPFDEHATANQERKKEYSACMLIAQELDLMHHSIYKRLVELVTEADQGGVHEFHIANRLKTSYRLNPHHPEKAISLINDILDDWEKEQQLFVEARKKLQQMALSNEHRIITLPSGTTLTLAVIQSNNYKVNAAARSLRIPIFIQQQKDGHTQVFCDTDRHNFDMRKVAAKLRKAECVLSGKSEAEIKAVSEELWEREGKIPEVTNWFYQIPGQNILNGTETTPEVPPTKIPLNIIVEIVQKHLIYSKKEREK